MGTIRRYSSRKLYDPTASRYVSLEEVAQRIRGGEEIEVRESASGEDVTAQTLAQILLEEGKSGRARVPAQLLHDLVRVTGQRTAAGSAQAQRTVARLMRASLERLAAIPEARREARKAEERLRQLDDALARLEKRPARSPRAAAPPAKRRGGASRRAT